MKTKIFLVILLFIGDISCKKDAIPKPADYPFLVTQEVSANDSTGVTLSAKVLNIGIEDIVDYGFILKYDNKEYKFSIYKQSDLSSFQLRLKTNLEKQKKYIYRAYIQTKKHTVLANEVIFTSNGSNSPQILDFSPVEGFDSTVITLKGSNFGYDKNVVKAFINGLESKIEYFSNDTLKIRVPMMEFYGDTKISIKLGSKTTTSDKQYKLIGPVIDSISKTTGYSGDYLTISGKFLTNNGNNLKVFFGNNSSEIIRKTENKIELVIPINYSDLLNDVSVIIKLENGLKSVSYNNNFLIKKSWIRKQDPPFGASWYETFTSDNNHGYFLNINEKKLFEYNEYSDTWNNISTYLGVNNYDYCVFVCLGNKFFKIGGYNYLGKSKEFWEFDLITGIWKQRNNIPFGFYTATSFILNNTLYIITDIEEVWAYNENTDIFTRKNDFPEDIDYFISFVSQNKAYVVNAGRTYAYDAQSDSWTIKSLNQFTETYNMTSTIGFGYKGTGYVLYNGSLLYRYDLLTNKWILSSQYPEHSTSSVKSTFLIGNRAYLGTIEGFSDPYPRLYSYED
jgi:hypothetical protein